MKTYGYCRVSTKDQSIVRQKKNILREYPDAVIFAEAFTGRLVEGRKELARLLKVVKPGDQIIFDSVSRMSRDAVTGYELYMQLYDQGIELHFLKEPQIDTTVYRAAIAQQIDTETLTTTGDAPTAALVKSILDALNEFTRELARRQILHSFEVAQKEVDDLRQRTREGMAAAVDRDPIGSKAGRRAGTGSGYNLKKYEKYKGEIVRLSRDFQGGNTDAEIMKVTGLARGTYYAYKNRVLAEQQAEQDAALTAARTEKR